MVEVTIVAAGLATVHCAQHLVDTRPIWRAAVAEVAARAKPPLPASATRIDKAVALGLAGAVDLLPDGTARVASQSKQ